MMKFIDDFLHKRRQKKIKKEISRLLHQAMVCQRNGNLREYANTMKQITELEEKIDDPGN